MTRDSADNTTNMPSTPPPSVAVPAGSDSPLTLLRAVLEHPTDLAHVRKYTTDDFVYVSLNYEHAALKQIMPWAGTTAGTEGLVQTFKDVFTYWSVLAFELQDSFENADGAAIFGFFTYRSNTLDITVTSPLSILARARHGRLSYVQFMEDTFATVRSFRKDGTYRLLAQPGGPELEV